jgi:chromosomal replication initiation ATPase DnaA
MKVIAMKNKMQTLNQKIERLHRIVCTCTGVDYDSSMERTRSGAKKEARQLTMYICKEYAEQVDIKCSLAAIGKHFICESNPIGYDHATVLHSHKTIKNLRFQKSYTNIKIETLIDNILVKYGCVFNNNSPFLGNHDRDSVILALTGVRPNQ